MTARQDILDKLDDMKRDGVVLIVCNNALSFGLGVPVAAQAKWHQFVQSNRAEITAAIIESGAAHKWLTRNFPGVM